MYDSLMSAILCIDHFRLASIAVTPSNNISEPMFGHLTVSCFSLIFVENTLTGYGLDSSTIIFCWDVLKLGKNNLP